MTMTDFIELLKAVLRDDDKAGFVVLIVVCFVLIWPKLYGFAKFTFKRFLNYVEALRDENKKMRLVHAAAIERHHALIEEQANSIQSHAATMEKHAKTLISATEKLESHENRILTAENKADFAEKQIEILRNDLRERRAEHTEIMLRIITTIENIGKR